MKRPSSPNPESRIPKALSLGFTLVEMAVVLVVMGLVIMTVFPALVAVRSANQISLTQSNLRSLMLATAAYVQANGCLPCPAVPGDTATKFGYVSTGSACGACTAKEGIPPFVSLGISQSTAHDGWGHWITMRVDPALTSLPSNAPNSVFVPPTSLCTTNDNSNACLAQSGSPVGYSDKGICKYNLSASNTYISVTTTGNGATQKAAVIFVSHGSTGYGSYIAAPRQSGYLLPFASNYAACNPPNGGFAQCNNAANNSSQFFDAPAVVSDTDSYDDILAYADRNTLVSMFGNGACATTW